MTAGPPHTPIADGPPFAVVGDFGVGFGALAFALTPTAHPTYQALLDAQSTPHPSAGNGGSATPYRDAARAQGGIHLGVQRHPPVVVPIRPPTTWAAVVLPLPTTNAAPLRNALPRTVHTMKHARQAALTAALALGLQSADVELIRTADADAIVDPAIGPQIPAYFPCQSAARAAGAVLVGIDPESRLLVCLCPSLSVAHDAADAIVATLRAHALTEVPMVTPLASPIVEVAA